MVFKRNNTDACFVAMILIVGIVFTAALIWSVYYLCKVFEQSQTRKNNVTLQNMRWQHQQATLAMRLPAYERLSLFCDRISLVSLLERIDYKDFSVRQFEYALTATIQQEYAYNSTQFLYLSHNAVEILRILRQSTTEMVQEVAQTLAPTDNAQTLADALLRQAAAHNLVMVEKTKEALHVEVSELLNFK